MDEHFFVSYSAVDAADFALALANKLVAGPPSYPVWVDKRDLRPGEDWDEQIVEALRTCRGLLLVMTTDSVSPESVCKQEWVRALKYKKPVIPLLLHPDVELPFRLGSRQFIDFSGDINNGLAQLRDHLAWTNTPAGVLQELRIHLADARRELPRAAPGRQPLIEGEIIELDRRITAQQHLIDNPAAAQQQTTQRIETGLERERQPERPVTAAPRARFVNPPPMTAPTYFQDRERETALVADYLRIPELRMTTVVGRGGVGKTALVCRLLKALEVGRLPDDLGELVVDGIVYLSPVGAHPVNFPNLFEDLCRLLPDDLAQRLRQRYRDPQETPARLMLALLEAFPAGRSVVLLDNVEDVIDAGTGTITDPALDEALRTLLTAPEHGIKVVITIRVAPRDLLLTHPAAEDIAGQGAWWASVEQYSQAIQIADEIGYALMQHGARVSLAQTHLLASDLDACRTAAEDATAQLQQTSNDYLTLECKALALCGLTLTDHPDQLPEAIALFRAARAITTAPGIVTRTLRLLDAITVHDTAGHLATARTAAQGDPG